MRGRSSIFIGLALSLILAKSGAQDLERETTLQMQSYCRPLAHAVKNPDGAFKIPSDPGSLTCWGAFAAIQELSVMGWNGTRLRILGFCAPPETSRITMIQIFEDYAERRPDMAHESFTQAALNAFMGAFPCPH